VNTIDVTSQHDPFFSVVEPTTQQHAGAASVPGFLSITSFNILWHTRRIRGTLATTVQFLAK
jgi:hypothetical protein